MKRLVTFFVCVCLYSFGMLAAQHGSKHVGELLDRIGGKGTSERFIILVDEQLAADHDGEEVFVIASRQGKPYIAGSTASALTAGIGWYLNHYALVNLSWNQLTTDLRTIPLPLPKEEERHRCGQPYRYYLNYCTFGYSMATWTWERWQQEIDWMALHGINMPLQIVGLEAVWRDFLIKDCGYGEAEAERFIPGPAFTPWWAMNNLEGWGGDGISPSEGVHRKAWYKRQAELAKRICDRERELGMQPVLPGFSGMVPNNFEEKTGVRTERVNLWCQFQRPTLIDPSLPYFNQAATNYYKRLEAVMGTSTYYSMDPFHEGGTIQSGNYAEGYHAVYEALNNNCGTQAKWVIQQWQWADYQQEVLQAVPAGRLIVLDLFSDGKPAFDRYQGYLPQDAIFCTIPNFGGRTGFMGRLPQMTASYFALRRQYPSIKGIGCAPEAIESVPVVYDLLFELPWMAQEPDLQAWIGEYAERRYGRRIPEAEQAWNILLHTALNEQTSLQGPHEAVMCARPSLNVERVSSWGGTQVFYDKRELRHAALLLLTAARATGTMGDLGAENMGYDLTDLTRQVMSDYSQDLLQEIRRAYEESNTVEYQARKEEFLQLILDTDSLLGTNRMFRLGRWTEMARQAAGEMKGGRKLKEQGSEENIPSPEEWMEYRNARTLITTWGNLPQSEQGGLHDYSYRQWQGLLSDYYLPRWQYFFNHHPNQLSTPAEGWFYSEWNWANELEGEWGDGQEGTHRKSAPTRYSPTPKGNTIAWAEWLLQHYFTEN